MPGPRTRAEKYLKLRQYWRRNQELEPDERELFLSELGIEEPGVAKLAKAVYSSLDLISF